MPLTVACPNCPAKLKVPEAAAGRRVKCPKCGGVMTVPAAPLDPTPAAAVVTPPAPVAPRPVPVVPPPPVEDLQDLAPTSPPPAARAARRAEADDPPARAARRRDDDSDERPAPRAARPAATKRRDDGNDYHPNDYRSDDPDGLAPRLHRGWKMVALGYRMLGLAMLFSLLGVLGTVGGMIAFGGSKAVDALSAGAKSPERVLELATPGLAVGGVFLGLAGLFAFLGYLFLMLMPKDEDGGKGKTLGIVMFILLFIPGLNALVPWLLPLYSAGVGTALGKPKLRKYGFGLYVWYAVGFILIPLLAGGALFAGWMIDPPVKEVASQGMLISALVAGVISLILGLVVFFSVWGTFAGMRRGITASIRERGVIDGEDPRPAETPRGKKGKRDDDEDERPARGQGKGKGKDRDSSAEHRPVKVKAKDPEPEAPRPAKRKRDDDSDDDQPRAKRRRDDDDSDDGSRRKRR